jgi:transcriptional regulator with XRE-family HTH domain
MIRSAAEYRRCCEELAEIESSPAKLEQSARLRARHEELVRERALYEALLRDGVRAVPAYAPEARGQALIALRLALRLSQAELAALLGVSAPVVSRDENAAYEGISLERYGRILHALGIEEDLRGFKRGTLALHEPSEPYRRAADARGTVAAAGERSAPPKRTTRSKAKPTRAR